MYDDDLHLMVAFATLPEAIYHAHKVETYTAKILHVRPRSDLAPSCVAMHIYDLSTPAACDLVQLPTGTARSNAIESGMWLIHKSPRFSALIEHAAPSLRIPMASSPHAPWIDLHRSADAPPLPPGAAAIDWSKNRFRGAMVNEAALWLRTFHDSYLNIRPLIAELRDPPLHMSYVIMPTTVSQPSTPRDDDAILALTSLVAPTRHGLVMNDLPDAVALAHRLRGSVTIAVAPAASVASAVPHDVYIAAYATGAIPHRAITHARPSVLQLASAGPGLTFPDETDRLSIPVDGWNQALFDARNHPDRRLHRLRYPGNTLPQDPMSLDSPSRDGWTGSANVKLLQLVAAWRARSPAATPPVNQMDLSLVTDASLQTPPDDNLLMHAYQDRTSSRWDRQLHRERLDHRVAAGFDAPPVQNPWQITRRHHEDDFAACFGYTRGRPDRQALMWVYHFGTHHARGGHWEEWVLVAMRQHPTKPTYRTSTVLSMSRTSRHVPDDLDSHVDLIVTPRMALDSPPLPLWDLWSEDDVELPHRKVWFPACKDPSSSFPDRGPPRPDLATFILDTLRKARWLRTQLPAHHFHDRFHGLMQAGSLDTTYVQDRTQKRRDYIDDFGCYAPGSPYPVGAHNHAATHMPIVFLALGFAHTLSQTDLEHVTFDSPASVCSCMASRTHPQRCTVVDDEPFHTRVWDTLCRNMPQLSTGHDDRLLPDSWTKDPSFPPADVTRGLPVVPIPDTAAPPDRCYCICGEHFSTKARLRLHANGPHRPGTKHHAGLHFLARIGGAYVLFNTVTNAVILAGMARFPVQCGDVPSSTLAESRTILLALIHITRRLPSAPHHTIRIHTDSKSSTQGSQRLHNSTTARDYLHNKFSSQWDLAQHLIHELLTPRDCSRLSIYWIPTEHGRPLSDPERLTETVLVHRTVDVAAGVATSSGRDTESSYIRVFSPPTVLDHPIAVSRAGSVQPDPVQTVRESLNSHSASRLVAPDEKGASRSTAQAGPTSMAEHAAHPSATTLLVSTTPSIHMDAGRRDMLGRTHTSMSAVRRTLAPEDRPRLDAALTGDDNCREYNCISCDARKGNREDEGTASHHQHSRSHFWSCPSLLAYRRTRCLSMANAVASFGIMMHHAHHLRHRVSDRSAIPAPDGVTITATPVVRRADHDGEPSLVSVAVLYIPPSQHTTMGVSLPLSRARAVIAQMRPGTPLHEASPFLSAAVSQPIAHPDVFESVTVLPSTLVSWYVDTFHLNGQAHTTPMTYHDFCPTHHPSWLQRPEWVTTSDIVTAHPVGPPQTCSVPRQYNSFISIRSATHSTRLWKSVLANSIIAAKQGRTVVVAVTFDTTFSNRSLRNLLLRTAGSYAHLITTLTPGCLPVGSAIGWPEPTVPEEGSPPRYSTHVTHNTATVPASLDTHRIPRHQNIAAWSKDTKFILFTEHAPTKALAVPVDRIHLLTTILRGTLILPRAVPHSPMGVWWAAETPRPLSYLDLPVTLDTQSLRCLRMCMWEPSDIAPAIDTADVEGERRTRVGRHRFWLREAATRPGYRIPLCLVPNALVQYLRTALGVLTTENQRAAVRIVQAALRGLYLMERAHAAQIAYHMALLGISTPTTLHTHRGIPIETIRCEACGTNVTSCWELRTSDGPSATTAIENFLSTHCRGPTLTAMRKHPDFKAVANTFWARYAATVRQEGILACWPCTAPTAWELHCTSLNTNPIARPQNLPAQRPTTSRLATREQERESDQTQDDSLQQYDHLKRAFFREQRSRIRDGRRVDTTAGLARAQTTLRQWRAPHTLPSRAPYGHGALLRRTVGGTSTPGEVCMVAPSPQDCGHDTDRPPADADLKAYLSHPCGMRTTGTDTAPTYTHTMTFSMVSVTEAYSMTGEPPPSNLCPTAAPQDPDRTDPRQADDPGATRNPPLPSQPATLHGNGDPPSPSPTSARARARARTPTQLAQTPRHVATLTAHDAPPPDCPTDDSCGRHRGGVRPHQSSHHDSDSRRGRAPLPLTGTLRSGRPPHR